MKTLPSLNAPPGFEFIPSLMEEGKIGRYVILRKLGEGGTGMVFLGRDPYIKRSVALKVTSTASEHARRSFLLEAQSAGRLNHPNIVAVYDFDVFGDHCYIAMEYVEGATLANHCMPERLLPLDRVAEIIFNVCHALDYAHKQGVIHRDIKPTNLLLDPAGTVKITDFGIATIKGKDKERGIVGTPAYMSPERLREEPETGASDMFSLACVLYELLTGCRTFQGSTVTEVKESILHGHPVPLDVLRPGLPEELAQVTMKALSRNPRDRYPSCSDFGYALRRSLGDMTGRQKETRDFFDYVLSNPFFRNFTKEQVKELVRSSNVIRVRKGQTVASGADADNTFFIMLSGRVRITTRAGNEIDICQGQCFGEIACPGHTTGAARVLADCDSSLMKINAAILDRAPESLRLLFFQNFALAMVQRLSYSD